MTEPCRNCGGSHLRSDRHDWSSICRNCGELHWLRIGDILECKVARLLQFGIFVEFGEGLKGLVHISELREAPPNHPKEIIGVDDELRAQVLNIDFERQTVGLSLRRMNP